MPQFIGTFESRIPIAAFFLSKTGLVAGFLMTGSNILRDSSGHLVLPQSLCEQLDPDRAWWLAVHFRSETEYELVYRRAVDPSPEVAALQRDFETHRDRWAIHRNLRSFFTSGGFLQVDTPLCVPCPGMEPYLESYPAGPGYLRTSPELHMKRLLAGGFDKIFQVGPCFRAGDKGKHHREEFLMLEWYRAFADLNHLIADLRALIHGLADFSKDSSYFRRPFQVISCQTLFKEHLGLQLRGTEEHEPLRACLRLRNIPFSGDDDWDMLYFLLFLNFIEPQLGMDRPTVVTDYPASQAALAKKAPVLPGAMPSCYRFELYLKGIEIANAFYELTDPVEQRQRFDRDRRIRADLGKVAYPIDEHFMAALESGVPPCAGIALGVDRLVTVLLGRDALDDILPF